MDLKEFSQVINFFSPKEREISLVTPGNAHNDKQHGSITVLHVDDDPEFADLTATFLEKVQDEFTVVTETNANDALNRLDKTDIAGIVSDYQMPEIDGLEFLRTVRGIYPDLPFILFTGKGSEEVASEAIAAGVTDYMQKSGNRDDYEVLANRVRNAIDQYWTAQNLWSTLQWYQRLVEQDLAGIYLVQDEQLLYVNERFADIFGYAQSELVGMSAYDLVAENDVDLVKKNLRRRLAGEQKSIRYTWTGERKNGEHVEIEVHGSSIEFGDKPAVIGILLEVFGMSG